MDDRSIPPTHDGPTPPTVTGLPAGALPFSRAFLERYAGIGLLGEGAMGTVYLMRQVALDRQVAVKVVKGAVLTEAERQRLQKEARVLASLDHPSILAIHDVGIDGDLPYMVCEYVPGETLAGRLARAPKLSLAQALKLASQVLDGLKAAHRGGIVHRDLKPANILLTEAGKAKIADFGLAREQMAPSGTAAGRILGTPPYMSPEQCRGHTATPASDLYAMGCVLFEMVTGVRPFPGPDLLSYLQQHTMSAAPRPSARRPGLPEALDDLIVRSLSKDPARRPAGAGPFRKEVQDILKSISSSSKGSEGRRRAPPAGSALEPGSVLDDRYTLQRVLGEGGMGKVWLATDEAMDTEVAIKLLPPELWRDPEAQSNVKQEAKLSQRLAHPNVVRLMNLEPGDPPFLVMEYVNGPTLSAALATRRNEGRGPLPAAEAVPIVEDIAAALDHAHQQRLVHRDVKPSNVMLTRDADGRAVAKLGDFGVAAEVSTFRTQMTGQVPTGTLAYMSPEQLACQKLDARADVYSLAATAYQMLSGRVPFAGGDLAWAIKNESPPTLDGVPPAIATVVLRALSKDPAQRPSSAGDLARALRAALGGGAVLGAPEAARESFGMRWAALLVAGVVAAYGATMRDGSPDPGRPRSEPADTVSSPSAPPRAATPASRRAPVGPPTDQPFPLPRTSPGASPATRPPTFSPTRVLTAPTSPAAVPTFVTTPPEPVAPALAASLVPGVAPYPATAPPRAAAPSSPPSPTAPPEPTAAELFQRALAAERRPDGSAGDDVAARALLRQAAGKGHAAAQVRLGEFEEQGRGGPALVESALVWYNRAADQGDHQAQYHLGRLYNEGRHVPRDFAVAVGWYRLAAAADHPAATYELAGCTWNGEGVAADRTRALELMEKAARLGNPKAQQVLPRMRQELKR